MREDSRSIGGDLYPSSDLPACSAYGQHVGVALRKDVPPTSRSSLDLSRIVTRMPALPSPMAVARPHRPAPTMRTWSMWLAGDPTDPTLDVSPLKCGVEVLPVGVAMCVVRQSTPFRLRKEILIERSPGGISPTTPGQFHAPIKCLLTPPQALACRIQWVGLHCQAMARWKVRLGVIPQTRDGDCRKRGARHVQLKARLVDRLGRFCGSPSSLPPCLHSCTVMGLKGCVLLLRLACSPLSAY